MSVDYEDMREKLVRGASEDDVTGLVNTMIKMRTNQAFRDVAVMAFQTRDIRGGRGERRLFYLMFKAIAAYNLELAQDLIPLIPEYGSWDDMFTLATELPPILKLKIFRVAAAQLEKDEKALATGEPISLLGKWAPREGKAFSAIAADFARHISGSINPLVKHSQVMASYRRRLVRLNAALKTVETLECANKWDQIEPGRVPLAARRIKMAAYLNEVPHRKNVLREAENEKRNACRENFSRFLKTEDQCPILGAQLDDARYDPVRQVVDIWLEGGWRV
jgi:hypothetical protein